MDLKDTIDIMAEQVRLKGELDPDEQFLEDKQLLNWLKELDELRSKEIDLMKIEETLKEENMWLRISFAFSVIMVLVCIVLSVCLHDTRESFDELEQVVYEHNIDIVE